MIARSQITGLILAGGQGSRMGGVDKGLQDYRGMPLALHVLQRLAPQVGRVMISANRQLDAYQRLGVPVWPDDPSLGAHPGPLAGLLAGLQHCETAYLASAPCDGPFLAADLVQRLAQALAHDDAEIAVAATRHGDSIRLEPMHCLIKRELADSLARFMQTSERKVERWTALHRRVEVVFDDSAAFVNVNTAEDLAQLPPAPR